MDREILSKSGMLLFPPEAGLRIGINRVDFLHGRISLVGFLRMRLVGPFEMLVFRGGFVSSIYYIGFEGQMVRVEMLDSLGGWGVRG